MSDRDDFGTFLAGFVVGGLIGATVAMLFAPQSGEETRTLIRDKSIELKDRAVVVGQDARAHAEKALEEARTQADAAIEELRVRSVELAEVTKAKVQELQERGQVVLDEGRSRLGAVAKKASTPPPAPEEPAVSES